MTAVTRRCSLSRLTGRRTGPRTHGALRPSHLGSDNATALVSFPTSSSSAARARDGAIPRYNTRTRRSHILHGLRASNIHDRAHAHARRRDMLPDSRPDSTTTSATLHAVTTTPQLQTRQPHPPLPHSPQQVFETPCVRAVFAQRSCLGTLLSRSVVTDHHATMPSCMHPCTAQQSSEQPDHASPYNAHSPPHPSPPPDASAPPQ